MPRRISSASEATAGPRPPDDTDAVLGFMRLIWAVDHELERVSKRMEQRLGLTITQRMSLLLIAQRPGILASELAAVLHLHRATVSGIVQRLQVSGYVEGVIDPNDGRRIGLLLTRKGRAASLKHTGTFESAVRRLLDAIPTRDHAAAERVLARLGAELRAVADSSSTRSGAPAASGRG